MLCDQELKYFGRSWVPSGSGILVSNFPSEFTHMGLKAIRHIPTW